MATEGRRARLTSAQRERVRRARIRYSMRRYVDPGGVSDDEEGWQSWSVSVVEPEADEPFASFGIHRVPLNNGVDIFITADCDSYIPHDPVFSVIDYDRLKPEVISRLADPAAADGGTASMLVLEPIRLDEEWRGVGVAELLWGITLAELRTSLDALAIVSPGWAQARAEDVAAQRRTFKHLGFETYDADTWILPDWSLLNRACTRYRALFALAPPPTAAGYFSLNGMDVESAAAMGEVLDTIEASGLLKEDDCVDIAAAPLPLPMPSSGAWYTPSAVVEMTGADIAELQAWQLRSLRAQEVCPSGEVREDGVRVCVYSEADVAAIRSRLRRRNP